MTQIYDINPGLEAAAFGVFFGFIFVLISYISIKIFKLY